MKINKPKELVVISGKGGTGKTSITAALAQCFSTKVLADCDVDAADLHLITNPKIMLRQHSMLYTPTFIIEQQKNNSPPIS